ncbi:hypothetical protein [Nonomuraea typhae]|uniref:XRE family transcriptional regulator n=1 Tax=Nonomuraea typhae TaxID=2603600 RepID=A0ABW7YNC4_9ACTN
MAEDLKKALEDGPFSAALRLAVQESGLSLDRLQHRLRERDISISRTTLSYWQSGRTQPERPASLRAVRVLEEVLAVPEGGLLHLLGPPRPRGRWAGQLAPRPPRPDQSWARPEGLRRALAQLEATPESLTDPECLRHSVLVRLDAHRQIRTVSTQTVLRATRQEAWRALVVCHAYMAGAAGPAIAQARGWRPGRIRADEETGIEVHEMLLDRILPAGQSTVATRTLAYPPGHLDPHTVWRAEPGTRELTVEVEFDPGALPVRCHAYHHASIAHPRAAVRELWIGASRTAARIVLDPEPGLHGVAWEWD